MDHPKKQKQITAKNDVDFVNVIASMALVSVYIMKQKSPLAIIAIVLVVAAIIIAISISRKSDSQTDQQAADPSRRASVGASASGESDPAAKEERLARRRERENEVQAELISEYGESRTHLARTVANNVVGLFEDVVAMGEMMTKGESPFGGPRAAMNMALGGLNRRLELSDEQSSQAAELFNNHQKRQIEETKGLITKMKQDPSSVMKLMLASDEFTRGNMSEEEFQRIQQQAGQDLQGAVNPLDHENFRGGQPLEDEEFVSGMRAVLNPDQLETFNEEVAQRQASAADAEAKRSITSIPSMELEKMDEAISSARKLTGGVKQMMEGMSGLRELEPDMQEGTRRNEGGE